LVGSVGLRCASKRDIPHNYSNTDAKMARQGGDVSLGSEHAAQSDRSADMVGGAISSSSRPSHGSSFRSTVLRSNLTRDHKNRDPLFYYEVEKVLGVGSMGSVVKVKKRNEVVGGSARKELQDTFRREKIANACVKIPFCGWFAQNCLRNPLGNHKDQGITSVSGSVRNFLSSNNSSFKAITDSGRSLESLGTLDSPAPKVRQYDLTFAMKSIHLSRVTDETFVEELRNEIAGQALGHYMEHFVI